MIVATMPFRNEDWIAGLTLRAALMWVDAVVAYDHASQDRTPAILAEVAAEFPGRVHVVRNENPSWDEMQHRQAMLEKARSLGATHIVILDADELLTGNLLGLIRQLIEDTPSEKILQIPLYNLRWSVHCYHLTGIWGNRTVSLAFRDSSSLSWQGEQFHHREPFGILGVPRRPLSQEFGGILHFWGVSERRLIAKHALYKMTERIRWPQKLLPTIDQYYNQAIYADCTLGKSGPWTFAQTPVEWLKPYEGLMQYFHPDAKPWQVGEVIRMLAVEGAAKFQGLDLFGALDWKDETADHRE